MKTLNLALLLMMSVSLPAFHPTERTPASEIKNSGVEELLKEALELRQRGDFEGAMKLLEQAEKLDPNNLDVIFYVGLTFYNLGKFEISERKLREVITRAPMYVDAKIILGRTLIALGRLEESENLLRQAIAQTPDYMDAYDALASNFLARKKSEEAIFIIDLGLARKPDDSILLAKKATIYFIDKNYAKAKEVAKIMTGLTEIQGRYKGHVLLGKIAFEENPMKIELAIPDLEEAIDLEPTKEEAYLVLADVHISHWQFQKGQTLLEQALDVVGDRKIIEKKLADLAAVQKGVLNYSVFGSYSQTDFEDGRAPWRDFYLDAVWRIDPFKTLVFGLERYGRGNEHDESVRIEYVEKINKWIYLYASAKVTIDPDFREKTGFKVGSNFVTNPLATGSTVIVAEGEMRNYETGKVYFITGGIDQYIGDSVVINARVFRVITDTQSFNVWSLKSDFKLTPRLSVNANYGTMTEDVNGRLVRGNSRGVGAQYRINDNVSITGNYQRINNENYRANQVTVGLKVGLGGRRTSARPVRTDRPLPRR